VPKVTYTRNVSDEHLKAVLQRIADFLKKDVTVHSGDRGHVPQGGSRTSLHLQHRAADFHISGLSDEQAFKALKSGVAQIFDATHGYEFIYHGPHTETEAHHLHLGHYAGKYTGLVVFKTEGLTKATRGEYTPEPVEISKSPKTSTSSSPTKPPPPPPKNTTPLPKTSAPTVAHGHDIHLGGSVGIDGSNHRDDVLKVQALLNIARRAPVQAQTLGKYYEVLAEDGICGDNTRRAIRLFQTYVVRMQHPDGRIDPNGRTLQMLSAWSDSKPTPTPPAPPANKPSPAPKKPVATKDKGTKQPTLPQPTHEVQEAIHFASVDVGVDYGYMMAMAAQESGFDPAVKAKTTSATGLYQFLSATWLEMLYRRGQDAKYAFCGLKSHADKVKLTKDSKGKVKYSVTGDLDKVLETRKVALYSALMGAEFAKSNKRQLENVLTTDPKNPYVVQPTDLYLAHFLGAGDAKRGASRFLGERRVNGNRSAADLFPDEADANESVFFKDKDRDKPRSLNEVYQLFEKKIGAKVEAYNRTRPAAAACC
jgi:hypothetical protein